MSVVDFFQQDVIDVAEMAVEPSWLSEIARKLRSVDDRWFSMSWSESVRRVGLAVFELEDREDIVIEEVLGGQDVGSVHRSFGGSTPEDEWDPSITRLTRQWEEYKIVWNPTTDLEDVDREGYLDLINPTITVEDKVETAQFLSSEGNKQSKLAEEVVQDQIRGITADWIEFEESPYESPRPDVIMRNFIPREVPELQPPGLVRFVNGVIVEVSNRWVNWVDNPYLDDKTSRRVDIEKEGEVPIFMLIIAPRIRDVVRERFEIDDLVDVAEFPSGDGTPVLVKDTSDVVERFEGTNAVGPKYPVVDSPSDKFQADLEASLREFNVISEIEYRRGVTDIFNEFLARKL